MTNLNLTPTEAHDLRQRCADAERRRAADRALRQPICCPWMAADTARLLRAVLTASWPTGQQEKEDATHD